MKYKIVKPPVILDFLTARDQITMMLDDGIVEWDGTEKSWYISPEGKKRETINYGWVIQKQIDEGKLEKITDESL